MGSDKGLVSLQIWRRSVDFAVDISRKDLPLFPVEEKWALIQQLRRASQSISANIAEGYGRYYYQEGIRFCYLARGSFEEVYSHLRLAQKLGYLKSKDTQTLFEEIVELRRMLNGYVNFLKQSKHGEGEPGSQRSLREDQIDYRIEPDNHNPDF
ncbi:MAG: four helix bundle protein [Chloroflexi bacterium]|nr:four helix bundle protein [Chloroflexota bacterium]